MAQPITIPDLRLQYQKGGCCTRKKKLTDGDRIVFNSSNRRFEISRRSRWSCCFSASELQKNAQTWEQFKRLLTTVSGKQNVDVTFSNKGIPLSAPISDELTLGQYEALKKSVEDITSLQPRALAILSAVRLYDIYVSVETSERDPKIEFNTDRDVTQRRLVYITGGDVTKGKEKFDQQKMFSKIKELPYSSYEDPISDVMAGAIANSVERDLQNEKLERISRDELNRRVMKYLKQAEYQLQEPYGWATLGYFVQKRITQLDLDQYKLLFSIAEEFERSQGRGSKEISEGKERSKEDSHKRHRGRSRGVSNYQDFRRLYCMSLSQSSTAPKHMQLIGATFDALEKSPTSSNMSLHRSRAYDRFPLVIGDDDTSEGSDISAT